MGWVVHDFECKDCSLIFEELHKPEDTIQCECGSVNVVKLLTAPNIAAFSISSKEQQVEKLKKRSKDHSKKELMKEPERFGAEGKRRSRVIRKEKPMVGFTGK